MNMRFLYISLLCLAAWAGKPVTALEIGPPVSLCTIAEELRDDLERFSGYTAAPGCPVMRFSLPPERRGRSQFHQVGSFDLETTEIGLAADLDMTTAYGRSVLLHEMVHLAQHVSGTRFPCPQAREYEAYMAQAAYLRSQGAEKDARQVALFAVMLGQCQMEEY